MANVAILCLSWEDARVLRAIRDGLPVQRSERKRARVLLDHGMWAFGTPAPAFTPDHLTESGAASLAYFDNANAADAAE